MIVDSLPYYLFFFVTALAVIGGPALMVFPRSRRAGFRFARLTVPRVLCLVYTCLLPIRMPYIYLQPYLILPFVSAGLTLFAIVAATGGGWSEVARFEAQPPTNTAPAAARPDLAARTA